ncbi:hypothetical protein GCM10018980_46460 [Streptomyces capoamus]|uniref:Uncharacterized protein n=1 Tax=Streptomyces capoamus TaxID=68183 RepID=A0A919EYI2_9ACTN|nr:hypothetical protein GCM10010501_61900 [Streptomyces libani subsp. rufus]GHG58880.1 hypothetical protein GCM10018980_46460 [Streptomyces capoamus]
MGRGAGDGGQAGRGGVLAPAGRDRRGRETVVGRVEHGLVPGRPGGRARGASGRPGGADDQGQRSRSRSFRWPARSRSGAGHNRKKRNLTASAPPGPESPALASEP